MTPPMRKARAIIPRTTVRMLFRETAANSGTDGDTEVGETTVLVNVGRPEGDTVTASIGVETGGVAVTWPFFTSSLAPG